MNDITNIEDLLEASIGLRKDYDITIPKTDMTIMRSIGTQVYRGTALTDRQHDLVKEKLTSYKDQFNIENFEEVLNSLRMPLRQIDRRKYIKVASLEGHTVPYIKVRFPFSKKLILKIQEELYSITKDGGYHHEKGSHEHYFEANEINIYHVVNAFKDSNFVIDEEILSYYEKLKDFENNKGDYVPGVYNYKLKNLSDNAIDYIISSIGEPTQENIVQYRDRKELLGLKHFDDDEIKEISKNYTVLTNKLIFRDKVDVFVNKNKYTMSQVIESLIELDRFPLLVILDDNNINDSLHEVAKEFLHVMPAELQSVVFRLDNTTEKNIEFNQYVKRYNLNSPVDTNTKIVYNYYNNKLPKPLFKTGWRPITVLQMRSQMLKNNNVDADLRIHFDDNISQFMRFNRQGIQEL